MAKGRNTKVISARLPHSVYTFIKKYADEEEYTVSEWLKNLLISLVECDTHVKDSKFIRAFIDDAGAIEGLSETEGISVPEYIRYLLVASTRV